MFVKVLDFIVSKMQDESAKGKINSFLGDYKLSATFGLFLFSWRRLSLKVAAVKIFAARIKAKIKDKTKRQNP